MRHSPEISLALSSRDTAAPPSRCLGCRLRGSELCRAVATSGLPGVRPARLHRIARDSQLFAEGHECDTIGILSAGILRRVRTGLDGRRTILGLVTPGDLAGGPGAEWHSDTLEAATDAEICLFDRATVRRMMAEDGRFVRHVLQQASEAHARTLELIWQRGVLTSRERIMAFLVRAAEVMPADLLPDGSIVVTVELSRRDWADTSNTTVETISRTLSQLADRDLVHTVGLGRYRIRDLRLLARLAGLDPDLDLSPPRGPVRTCAPLRDAWRLTAVNDPTRAKGSLRCVPDAAAPPREDVDERAGNAGEEVGS